MEKFYLLDDETVLKLNELNSKYVNSPIRLENKFIGDNKLKKLIKIAKVSDAYTFLYKDQVIVYVNESLWDAMYDDIDVIELLVREEFNSLCINTESGKIKIEKPSFMSSNSIIERYGVENVKRAKDMEKLCIEQAEDKIKDVVDISA